MNTLIIFLISAIAVVLLNTIFNKSDKAVGENTLKALSVLLCILGIFRYFLSDAFVETVVGGADVWQSLLRWGYHIGYAVLPISVFFSSRLFRNIASCFSLPISILCALFYDSTFAYFVAEGAGGYYINEHLRHFAYTLELVIAIIIPILMQLRYKHVISLKGAKEPLLTLGITALILIQMMPSYIPNSLIAKFEIGTGMFGGLHLLWLGSLVAEIVLLHFIFRKRSNEDKYLLLVFLVIAQVMHTTSPMIRGFTFSRLPLQLCNIAAFFYLYMIIKKDRRVYDFCYLANMVGAAIAMVLVDFSSEALSFWNLHYIYEHSFVVMVPVLCYTLGIFPRLDKSAIKHMLGYFSIYFGFIFVFGTIVNGLDKTPDFFPVNHFYMFNPEVAVDYLPFVGFTGLVHWELGDFEIYPLLVLTIFVVFTLLNILFYFITRGIYRLYDSIKGRDEERELVTTAK